MSISDKLITIAENEQKVYEAGKQNAYDDFWDAIQKNGQRTTYNNAFTYWHCEDIRPKYKVTPTNGGKQLIFAYNAKLKKVEAQYFDLSQIPAPAHSTSDAYYTFMNCYALEEIEDIGLTAKWYTNTFFHCNKLHTIAALSSTVTTVFNSQTFFECYELQNVRIEGEIGTNIDFQYSSKLSTASIINIIEHLSAEVTGQTLTLSQAAVDNMEFTDTDYADWDTLISTKSNWTIILM